MKDLTDNFGIVISLWLPGFILLCGLGYASGDIAEWASKARSVDSPTVGGFLNVSLACLSLGILLSVVGWFVVDNLIKLTVRRLPTVNFSALRNKDTYEAFRGAVSAHYQYYQCYANALVACLASFFLYGWRAKEALSFP